MDLNRGEVLGRLLLAHIAGVSMMAVVMAIANERLQDVGPVAVIGLFASLILFVPVMIVTAFLHGLIARNLVAFCLIGPLAITAVSAVMGVGLLHEVALSAGFGTVAFYVLMRHLQSTTKRGWSEP